MSIIKKLNIITYLFFSLVLSILTPYETLGEEVKLIKTFDNWRVFKGIEKGSEVCFSSTYSRNDKNEKMVLGRISNGTEKKVEFMVHKETGFQQDVPFLMEVLDFWSADNNEGYHFYAKKINDGWSFIKNIERDSEYLDQSFAKKIATILHAKDAQNKDFWVRFSLKGYTAAANFMESYCPSKPLPAAKLPPRKDCNLKNPEYCDGERLCSMTTETRTDGKKEWRKYRYYSPLVAYAKKQKYNCFEDNTVSVASNQKDCGLDSLNACKITELCSLATNSIGGEKKWETRKEYQIAVEYAKENNFSCGVGNEDSIASVKKKCQKDSPKDCSVSQVCEMATIWIGGEKFWDKGTIYQKAVEYAKNKNYSCGVKNKIKTAQAASCSTNPKLCTIVELCNLATTIENGKKVWEVGDSSSKFVKFAKDNGLSCQVNREKKKNVPELVPASSGSGFFVSKKGHLITNEHVIEQCREVFLHRKGKKPVEANILARDVINDLALLKANINPTTVFSLSEEQPYLTQEVTAAGYPMVATLGAEIKVTKGIVSALSAPSDFSRIQVDAAVQPGNSGGPIFDANGNVLGVVVSGFEEMQNVNFGIKASVVKNLLVANTVEIIKPRKNQVNWRSFSGEVGDGTVLLSCWMTKQDLAELKKSNDKNRLLFDN